MTRIIRATGISVSGDWESMVQGVRWINVVLVCESWLKVEAVGI